MNVSDQAAARRHGAPMGDHGRQYQGGIGGRRVRGLMAGAAALGLAVMLGGCATRQKTIPYGGAGLMAPDHPRAEDAVYDMPLGPLDVVKVSVFRVPELSGEYQVDANGMLDLPLVGRLNVRNQTPQVLAADLRRLYGARYLNSPDIAVRLMSSSGANITVEGGVVQSGIYSLPGRTTLLGAVALAHGVNEEHGNPRRAAIFRKQGGKTFAAAFDLRAIRQGKMEDPMVYPGDTVVVESDNLRKLYRDLIQALPAFVLFRQL
ncbi:hypothetical protein GTZ99_00065 [Novosphingobium sp. FSY-8]|uniref:Polysaccharide export protein N-terminal domain-containing protein n=1 Tax=Novosphingobium ovatum TaxID=1908523 RepID=A0ABW9X8T6_9SPHN|nr:polysaccharide biosynthesis/export family protein [Novosphingobium ovatum]NBC34947.1 hypothetical protein [Novosphingobium ovatum]